MTWLRFATALLTGWSTATSFSLAMGIPHSPRRLAWEAGIHVVFAVCVAIMLIQAIRRDA
jgi:hypothetical protein